MAKSPPAPPPLTAETVDDETLYQVRLSRTIEVGPLTLSSRRAHCMKGRIIKAHASDVREISPLAR